MIEQLFHLSNHHGVDNYFRLHYGEGGTKSLNPCEAIPDEDLCLGVIDNSNLKSKRLQIFGKDRQPILVTIPETGDTIKFSLPGKSALILLDLEACDKEFVKGAVAANFGFKPASGRYLHVATVGEIKKAGWIPYWAPLQLERKILHVRLVPECVLKSGGDPIIDDAERLAQTLKKIC